MNQEQQFGMECTEFEALLTEAVEGTLGEDQMRSFRAHASKCAVCAASLREATAGYQQLRSLEQVEVPATLMHNILVQTTGVAPASAPTEVRVHQSWMQRIQAWLRPALAPVLQPRMAGALAMAFFSITLIFSLLRIDPTHPASIGDEIAHTYFSTKSRIVRYYDSMRIVYELQAGVRELRNLLPEDNSQPEPQPQEQQQQQEKKEKNNKDISVQPQPQERERNQNYAHQSGNAQLASYTPSYSGPPYFTTQRNRRRTA